MQKKNLLILILSYVYIHVYAQNLVPNNSFENYGTLPCSHIITQSNFSDAMQNWIMPTDGSSDVFSTLVPTSCYANCQSLDFSSVGQQLPRTGEVMCGFCIYGTGGSPIYREYLEVMLTSPLIIGKTYSAEMYVSHGDYTQYASNNIGMYFSDTLVNTPNIMTPLNFIPQINENTIITNDTGWVKISGTFIATSPAQYLILGNFHNNFNTSTIFYSTRPKLNAYYYVDDVSVIEIIPCILESDDIKICEGSSATLIAHSNSLIGWAVDTLPDVIISSDSIIVVTPYHTTSYLAISNCDTISVMVDVISNCDIGIEFPNVFTPNNDGMNDNFIPIKYKGVSNANLSIYNRWGVQIFYTENLRIGWNGLHNSSICSEGIYYWIVQYTSVTNESKDLKGFLTLLK